MSEDYRLWSEFHDLKDTRFSEYLVASLDTIKVQLCNCNDMDDVKKLQGKAILLSEILGNIEKAHNKLVELRKDKTNISKAF